MARSSGAKASTPRPTPPPDSKPQKHKHKPKRPDDYSSDGVEDNDVFLLPISDYQVTLGITILAAIVRLFRIYQPPSVVFDEVQ